MAQHPVLKPDKDVPEFVTPKMGYYYVLDAGSNIARVNWTVSVGLFPLFIPNLNPRWEFLWYNRILG